MTHIRLSVICVFMSLLSRTTGACTIAAVPLIQDASLSTDGSRMQGSVIPTGELNWPVLVPVRAGSSVEAVMSNRSSFQFCISPPGEAISFATSVVKMMDSKVAMVGVELSPMLGKQLGLLFIENGKCDEANGSALVNLGLNVDLWGDPMPLATNSGGGLVVVPLLRTSGLGLAGWSLDLFNVTTAINHQGSFSVQNVYSFRKNITSDMRPMGVGVVKCNEVYFVLYNHNVTAVAFENSDGYRFSQLWSVSVNQFYMGPILCNDEYVAVSSEGASTLLSVRESGQALGHSIEYLPLLLVDENEVYCSLASRPSVVVRVSAKALYGEPPQQQQQQSLHLKWLFDSASSPAAGGGAGGGDDDGTTTETGSSIHQVSLLTPSSNYVAVSVNRGFLGTRIVILERSSGELHGISDIQTASSLLSPPGRTVVLERGFSTAQNSGGGGYCPLLIQSVPGRIYAIQPFQCDQKANGGRVSSSSNSSRRGRNGNWNCESIIPPQDHNNLLPCVTSQGGLGNGVVVVNNNATTVASSGKKSSCQCFNGWFGPDCNVYCDATDTCNGRGHCDNSTGTCVCFVGNTFWGWYAFTGRKCEKVSAPNKVLFLTLGLTMLLFVLFLMWRRRLLRRSGRDRRA